MAKKQSPTSKSGPDAEAPAEADAVATDESTPEPVMEDASSGDSVTTSEAIALIEEAADSFVETCAGILRKFQDRFDQHDLIKVSLLAQVEKFAADAQILDTLAATRAVVDALSDDELKADTDLHDADNLLDYAQRQLEEAKKDKSAGKAARVEAAEREVESLTKARRSHVKRHGEVQGALTSAREERAKAHKLLAGRTRMRLASRVRKRAG